MGSFRTPAARSADTALLTSSDTPALAEGEWVRYWTRLPHRAAVRLADEGVTPVMDRGGRRIVDVKVRAGTLDQVKLEEGIVAWNLLDEAGNPAPAWDVSQASGLLEGISQELKAVLREVIGNGEPVALTDVVNEEGQTEGEAFAGS